MSMQPEPPKARPHRARLESLGSMASGIAHEINTPIQFVGDNLQFISDSFTAIDQLLQCFADLQKAAQSEQVLEREANAVVKAMDGVEFDYLRAELPSAIEQSLAGIQQVARIASAMKAFAHRGSAKKEMADINQAIDMTVAICRNEWKYHADLELSLTPDLPKVACHIGELSQVWLNLIVNAAHAIKACPDIGHGLIQISTAERNGAIEISITDNGGGIPEEIRGQIFDRFFSTKESGEGSGQGLAICRDIVAGQHGGDIELWSEWGKGTRFTVRLPLESNVTVEIPMTEAIA